MSFLFYFSWLIIRKYDLGDLERFGSLFKPFLV